MKYSRRVSLFLHIALAVIVTTLGVTASSLKAQDAALPNTFSGDLAYQHVADHVNIGFRQTATLGSIQAGNLILEKLQSYGWETSEDWHVVSLGDAATMTDTAQQTLADWQPITLQDGLTAQIGGLGADVQVDQVLVPVRNLVATFGEPDNGVIIIGAHYDSRIYADHDPDTALHSEFMPGANDGGSGVGVLLELARVLSQSYTPNMQIRLVFFDAEDNGRIDPWIHVVPSSGGYLVGSSLYAQSLDLASDPVSMMILVDLVGEVDQRFPQEGYSAQYAADYTNAIWQIAGQLGYEEQFPTEVRGAITDDHVPFLQRGIPSVDIIDLEYEYWHTTLDTMDKISAESLERVGHVLQQFLETAGFVTLISG